MRCHAPIVLALLSLCGCQAPSPTSSRAIVTDGSFEDWIGIAPAVTDPADAPDAYIDLRDVRVAHDAEYLHLLLNVGRTVNIQRLDGMATIALDADGDPATGQTYRDLPGVDLLIDLTPPNRRGADREGMGIGIRTKDEPYPPEPEEGETDTHPSVYDIGLTFGPTYAHHLAEMRIERGGTLAGTPLFTGPRFSAQLTYFGPDGTVQDETGPFTYELTPAPAFPPTAQTTDPLARGDAGAVRIMTYNVLFGSIFNDPEPFARVISAIDPDAIVFQELLEENAGEQLLAWLNEHVPGDSRPPWRVIFGAGGGPLRSAVAARGNLAPVPAMHLIPQPERDDRSLRIAAGLWTVNGHRMLLTSAHFKCCGRIDSSEDITRRLEMQVLNERMAELVRGGAADSVVVAGDYNLVGSGELLAVMADGLDVDGSNLRIAQPYQLDGRSNATWADPGLPFVPGRLDYLLYSDASMDVARALVLETPDVAAKWREIHGLRVDDTAASDHRPLVVDLILSPVAP